MVAVVFVTCLIAIAFWVYKNQLKTPEPMVIENYTPTSYELNELEWQFFLLLKKHRQSLGLSDIMPETMCGMLATKRIHKLKHLSAAEFKENKHKGMYNDFQKDLIEHGFKEPSEILSRYWNSIPGMFRNYIESEDHKNYIEDPKLKYVGLGVIDYNYKFYSCIIFTY